MHDPTGLHNIMDQMIRSAKINDQLFNGVHCRSQNTERWRLFTIQLNNLLHKLVSLKFRVFIYLQHTLN